MGGCESRLQTLALEVLWPMYGNAFMGVRFRNSLRAQHKHSTLAREYMYLHQNLATVSCCVLLEQHIMLCTVCFGHVFGHCKNNLVSPAICPRALNNGRPNPNPRPSPSARPNQNRNTPRPQPEPKANVVYCMFWACVWTALPFVAAR